MRTEHGESIDKRQCIQLNTGEVFRAHYKSKNGEVKGYVDGELIHVFPFASAIALLSISAEVLKCISKWLEQLMQCYPHGFMWLNSMYK